jgi:hypothetical protein
MSQLPVKLNAHAELFIELIPVLTASAPDGPGLARPPGPPVRALDTVHMAVFEHRVDAADVADSGPEFDASAHSSTFVHRCGEPLRRGTARSASLNDPVDGLVESRGGLGEVKHSLLNSGTGRGRHRVPGGVKPRRRCLTPAAPDRS